jgi:hypothetical protein
MNHGQLHVLAIFDKPDPLDGPFFEETVYLTPSSVPAAAQRAIVHAVTRAAGALGLRHGPIHAECRIDLEPASGEREHPDIVAPVAMVLEVAARPIGGLCARALRFSWRGLPGQALRGAREPSRMPISLEELLLRHALGDPSDEWERETLASGVMMIPIPRRGVFRRVSGIDEARAVRGVTDLRITAKPDQVLVPLPEGASYLGFIFARGWTAPDVDRALRAAHAGLEFTIDPEVRMLQSAHV